MNQYNLWRITLDTNPEDCNLNCIMCEEHSEYSKFKKELYKNYGIKRRVMPFDWIENIFIQAKSLGVTEIIPSTMGEPLLYQYIDKIVTLCKQYNIQMNLTTNGTFPKKDIVEWANLLVPITSDIKLSWNGASSQTAESIMKGIHFETAIYNVKQWINIRNQYFQSNNYYSKASFQLTFLESNMHELSEIIKLAAMLDIDRVKGHHLWIHFSEIKNLSFKKNKDSINQWNQYVKEAYESQKKHLRPNGKKVILENIFPLELQETEEVSYNYNCPFLNKELWISATGKISPCCAPDKERDSLGDFGNITNKTMQDVLDSKEYKQLIQTYKQHPLCRSCNMRK